MSRFLDNDPDDVNSAGSGATEVPRARHSALVRDWHLSRGLEAAQKREAALFAELKALPAVEEEPDARLEIAAQVGAAVAFALGAEVSIQAMLVGAGVVTRSLALLGGAGLLVGLVGASWNTHVSRGAYWRPLAWAWAAVWVVSWAVGLAGVGASMSGIADLPVVAIGVGSMLQVSVFAGAVAFAAAMAAAHHVQAVAERRARNQQSESRRVVVERELGRPVLGAARVSPLTSNPTQPE